MPRYLKNVYFYARSGAVVDVTGFEDGGFANGSRSGKIVGDVRLPVPVRKVLRSDRTLPLSTSLRLEGANPGPIVMNRPGWVRFLCLAGVISICGQANPVSNCAVLQQGSVTLADVQQVVNEALGVKKAANDLNTDGVVNAVDVVIVVNAILGNGCAADPGLVSIVPNAGQPGTMSLAVTISGRDTSFTNSSSVSVGAGITVSNVAASSATTLTASLAIAGNAATGARTLTVDGLTLANAFTVTPPLSVQYTYDSQGRIATASYLLASGATTTVTYTYDAGGNRTSVVAH